MLTGEVQPLDTLISLDDLISEIYDPHPDARQLSAREQYTLTANSRAFPSYGIDRYGRSQRRADRVPFLPQVSYLPVLDISNLTEDFRQLPRLRRIDNPPPGIPENREYVHGKGTDDVVKEMKLYRNHNDPYMLDKKSFKNQKFVFFMDKVDEGRYIYDHKATYVLKNPNLVVIDEDDDDAAIAGEYSRKESLDALQKIKASNPNAQGVWLKFNDEVILWKFNNLEHEVKGGCHW